MQTQQFHNQQTPNPKSKFCEKTVEVLVPWNFTTKYAVATLAAFAAESVTYPLDLTKTRMQIQGEAYSSAAARVVATTSPGGNAAITSPAPPKRAGMFKTASGIIRQEGVLALWNGLAPALYRHLIYSGIRMGLYEKIRNDVLGREPDGSFPIYKAALGGLLAGGFAQFTASPMDLVKVQLQMEGRRRLEGKPPRVKNAFEALNKIYREGGVRGLWKGWVPNVQRGALVNLGDLTTYDTAKRFFILHFDMKDNYIVHILSSLMAGLTATIMGTPADVVKTRVMNQPTKNGVGIYYKSSVDCLRKTVANEGFWALYKGFLPIWMRLGPWSLTFWVSFEWIRGMVGVSSF